MLDAPQVWARWYPESVDPDYVPAPTTIAAEFDRFTRDYADRVAFDYNDRELTYADLRRDCARLANSLRAQGIEPGDVVGLYLPNTVAHPLFFFAAMICGAAVTHLSPLDAPRELEHKIVDSGAKLVVSLTTPPFAPRVVEMLDAGILPAAVLCDDARWGGIGAPAPAHPKVLSYEALTEGGSDALVFHPAEPEDVALLQYTGGTTGLPKAAVLTQGALAAATRIYEYAARHAPEFNGERELTLTVSPLFHIMGLCAIMLRRCFTGDGVILHQRFELNRFVDDIEKKRPASTGGVPTLWIAIANMPGIEKRDLSSLTGIGAGGAPMPVQIARRIEGLTGQKMGGGWGMTEIGAAGTYKPSSTPEGKDGSIGIPLPGIVIEVVSVDDPTRVLPQGESGEMRIRTPGIMTGYHNQPEETASVFVDGWFLTGDIGYFDADGFLYLVDRKKDLIISGGYNVYPQAIEQAIHQHPDVAEVMVVGLPDDYRGEAAWAYVVLKEGATPFALEDLRAFLDSRLGRHELPQGLEFRETLPRTAVGKYSRKMLRDAVLRETAAG